MNTSEHLSRRRFLTAAGTVGCGVLAGCSDSDTEPKSTVESTVHVKGLIAVYRPETKPYDRQQYFLLFSPGNDDRVEISQRVQEVTNLTNADVTTDTTINDLPMPKIYGELDIYQTFLWVSLHHLTTDEINGREPLEDPDSSWGYVGPTQYYDHIDLGATYRFRVAKPGGYYPDNNEGRIIDILERTEPATATEPE